MLKSLDNQVDRCLKSNSIWVRAGELQIGTEDACYDSVFDITLYGEIDEDHWSFTNSAGSINKALVVTGILNLHSCPTPVTSTRLAANAEKDDETIVVVAPFGLHWKVG